MRTRPRPCLGLGAARVRFRRPFPFAPEAAGILGLVRGKAPDQLALAERHLETAREALKADLQGLGVPVTPLGELLTEFGLDRTAMQILLVIAGPALWPEIARIYAMLSANDLGRPLVDELRIVELLRRENISRYEIAAQLAPRAPLMRYGLVRGRERSDRSRAFFELTVYPVVLARLRAEPFGDEEGAAQRIAGTCALESMALPPGLADGMLAVLSRPIPTLRLVLRGRRAAGRRTLVAALAARARRPAWSLDLALLPRVFGALGFSTPRCARAARRKSRSRPLAEEAGDRVVGRVPPGAEQDLVPVARRHARPVVPLDANQAQLVLKLGDLR